MIRKHKNKNLYNIFTYLEKDDLLKSINISKQFHTIISNLLIKSIYSSQPKKEELNKESNKKVNTRSTKKTEKETENITEKTNGNKNNKINNNTTNNINNNINNNNINTTNKNKNEKNTLFGDGKIEYNNKSNSPFNEDDKIINSNNLTNKETSPITLECNICYDKNEIDEKNQIFLDCGCIIHRPCFKSYVESELSAGKIPICPTFSCKQEINPFHIDLVVYKDPTLKSKHEKVIMDSYLIENTDDVSCCPTPGCEYVFFFLKGEHVFNCPICKKRYCLNCKVENHEGVTCEKFRSYTDVNSLDKAFEKFVKGKKFKQCSKCKFWVGKNQGCNHMTCRCKNEFCYVCGLNYRKEKKYYVKDCIC